MTQSEGLDIPLIDLVMFLRPTQSPTIFFQQLGRGLRKATGKKYLNVLDFIGNYKKAVLVPFLLTGDTTLIRNRNQRKSFVSLQPFFGSTSGVLIFTIM
ncbi:hypothetical protein SAMN02745207_04238 [Clostridium grantii DSM 8605]|uniref:Helicase C-terminal domain-containing protein n=1 Tax=Clostridium grantii DSM 8605 TaxID=1121316 RepID=A0A1M5Y6B0_9CLOT|nr:hypothetical protein SAMN02745207_04238 [Clostridium grantii DSM 8605]